MKSTASPSSPKIDSRGFVGVLDDLPRVWEIPVSPLADASAVAVILLIGAVTAYIGAVHTRIFGHDIFLLLDSGWRVINGQRPEVDFSPGIGPLLAIIEAAGLKLAGNSVQGVGYASALVGIVVGLVAYLLGRQRMGWTPSLLIAATLALIAVAPYPLGVQPNTLSHAMVYNRYGYALLGLVLVEAFQPVRRDSILAGISTGAVSTLLLFLKPSYGLVALAFAAWSLLPRRTPRRLTGIAIGLIGSGLLMMIYLRFDFASILHDFQMMAAARGGTLSLWTIRWALVKGLPEFLILLVLAIFVAAMRSREKFRIGVIEPLAAALFLFLGGGLLLATNAQLSGYPLNAVLAVLLVEQAFTAAKASPLPLSFLKPETVVLLVGIACFAPTLIANGSGLAYALADTRKHPPESEVARFRAPQLSSLLLYDVPFGTEADRRSNGRVFVAYINDGMDLLRRISKPQETVVTLDLLNPFPYVLLRPPARGGTSNLAYNFTYNDQYKPSTKWLFGAADIVMVPKQPSSAPDAAAALFRNFLPEITSQRTLCAESDWWELYKRPSNLEGCPIHP